MKIGILATGITPDSLLGQHGSYADMVAELISITGYSFEFETYDVRDDIFPESATDCDGWIITGSKFNVYQNLPWMARLKRLVINAYDEGRPMVGICFGHQIIAEAFGGRVEKCADGWGIGLQSYQLMGNHRYPDSKADQFTINAIHLDQVVSVPENAEVIATSEFCEFAALAYDDRILTMQSHPEFSIGYEDALLEANKGISLPVEVAEKGLASVRKSGAKTDSSMVARWMAEFLVKGCEVAA